MLENLSGGKKDKRNDYKNGTIPIHLVHKPDLMGKKSYSASRIFYSYPKPIIHRGRAYVVRWNVER